MVVLHLLAAVLALDEHVEHAGLHRAGAEQRDQRDDVVEDGRGLMRKRRSRMP